jgi:nitrate/nitrite-specific signal transduction histidine kinase
LLLGIRWGSLRTKIIAWSFVPSTIILVAVAVVLFFAYQQVTEDLVIERNRELVHLTAGGLASALEERADQLDAEARTANISGDDPVARREHLKGASRRLAVFDAGVVILDTFGTVIASEPERQELQSADWSDRDYYRRMLHLEITGLAGPVFSDIVNDGPGGTEVIVVAVPIVGDEGQFLGMMAGMFRLDSDASNMFFGDILELRIGETASTYLIDGNGRVIYHSDPERTGDEPVDQSLVQRVLDGEEGASRTVDLYGKEIVASFAPVEATSWGLATEESWNALLGRSQAYRRFLLLLLVLGVVVPTLVVAVGVRRLTKPVTELIRAAQEVAGGNFGQTITADTGDEIEELAEQFNLMSAQLRESYVQLERRAVARTQELAALNAIAAVASRSMNLDEILGDALDKTLEVMRIEGGGIYLLDEQACALKVATHRGLSPELVAQIDDLKVGEGFSGQVAQTAQPVVVSDISADPRLTRIAVQEEGLRSLASVPLSSRGRVLGTLFAVTRGYRNFSAGDVQLLTSIGLQIGIAIENARLFSQAQQVAVVEERSRLARELHDAVTQTLFSATLIAETLPSLWEVDSEEGRQLLKELRQLNRGALAEMRTLLLELRPASLIEASLGDLLGQLCDAATGRIGVPVALTLQGQCSPPSEVHVALYRIAQEALNNVVKHAKANRVAVSLRCATSTGNVDREPCHRVELQVTDDGIGFDPNSVQADRLGLAILRERAQAIGAVLRIESQPGGGTQVMVEWEEEQ